MVYREFIDSREGFTSEEEEAYNNAYRPVGPPEPVVDEPEINELDEEWEEYLDSLEDDADYDADYDEYVEWQENDS